MNPILLDDTKTLAEIASDRSLGKGVLSETISASVHEVANGEYTAEIVYPTTGRRYAELHTDGIIKLKPNETSELQMFRIKRITKPIDNRVTLYLSHISYDLNKAVVLPCQARGALGAVEKIQENLVLAENYPFRLTTDKSGGGDFKVSVPKSLRSCIGGSSGSFLDVYGAEIEWDNLNVNLWAHRGQDNGVTIKYAKNLTGLKFEENSESVYTAILPYATVNNQDGASTNTLIGALKIIAAANPPRVKAVDFSNEFNGLNAPAPTVENINLLCDAYAENNNLSSISISAEVNFVPLWQTEEYKHIAPLERVALFDTVYVKHPKLGVALSARVVETEYDCLLERYRKIHIGKIKATIASTISGQSKLVQQQKNELTSWWQDAIRKNTDTMNGVNGGYKYVVTDGQGRVVEEYWLDTPSIETAVNVRRENYNGIAYSHNGINGPFISAWLMDGSFTASLMQSLQLQAQQIVAGSLRITDGQNRETFYVNVDTGEVRIVADQFSLTSGQTLEQLASSQRGTIVKTETYYLVNNGTSAPTSSAIGWTKTPPTLMPGSHLWSMQKTTFLSGETEYTTPVDLSGPDLASATRYYKLSDSGTTLETTSLYLGDDFYLGEETFLTVANAYSDWTTNYPTYVHGKFLWTRWKFVYADGSILWTEPAVDKWYNDIGREISQHYEEMHTAFTQTNVAISLKADKTLVDSNYNSITGEIHRIEQSQSAALTVESGRILAEVADSIEEAKTEIGEEYSEAISTSMTTLRSEISQTASSLTVTLTGTIDEKVEELSGEIDEDISGLARVVTQNRSDYDTTVVLLRDQIAAKVATTTFNTTVNTLNGNIATAKSDVEAEITAAISGVTLNYRGEISTAVGNLSDSVADDLEALASDINGDISDLTGVVAQNRSEFQSSLQILQGQISGKVSQSDFNTTVNTLNGNIATAKSDVEAEITAAISGVTLNYRGEISTAVGNLSDSVADDLEALASDINGDISDLTGVVASNKTTFEESLELLEGTVNTKVSQNTFNQTVNSINGTIATEKSNLQTLISQTQSSILSTVNGTIASTKATIESDYATAIQDAVEESESAYQTSLELIRGQIALKASTTDVNRKINAQGALIEELRGDFNSSLSVATTGIAAEISRLETEIDSNGNEISLLQYTKTMLREDGLYVEDSANPSTTRITGNGLQVLENATNAALLETTSEGVTAKQLTSMDKFTINTANLVMNQQQWYDNARAKSAVAIFVTTR